MYQIAAGVTSQTVRHILYTVVPYCHCLVSFCLPQLHVKYNYNYTAKSSAGLMAAASAFCFAPTGRNTAAPIVQRPNGTSNNEAGGEPNKSLVRAAYM